MITLTPCYGRDYTSKAKVLAAFDRGTDFTINDVSNRWNGKPANNADLAGTGDVKFRYGNLNRVFVHTV
jgi:hypothetical protein